MAVGRARGAARLAAKYTAFAVIAVLVNLAFQYLSFSAYRGPLSLYVGIAVGTAAGLLTKYVLDRNYIFAYRSAAPAAELWTFVLYTASGVGTTALYVVTELVFDAVIDGSWAKYVGAVVGLAAGYSLKYRLDKRFVFGRS